MIYAHHSSEEDLLKMELGGGEASNSSNSFVCSQLVVCSSLSIQNSIWRVSGLFKLNFWSVSCPNSSTVGSSSRPFLYYRNSNENWRFEAYYKFSPLFRSCDLSYLAIVDIKRESSSSWYIFLHMLHGIYLVKNINTLKKFLIRFSDSSHTNFLLSELFPPKKKCFRW